jgi:hypothetical protein
VNFRSLASIISRVDNCSRTNRNSRYNMQPCFLCRRKLSALFALALDLAETHHLTIKYVSSMCKLYVFDALATRRHPISPSFELSSAMDQCTTATRNPRDRVVHIFVLMITNTDPLVLAINLHAGQVCRSTVFTGSEAYRMLTASYRRCFQIHLCIQHPAGMLLIGAPSRCSLAPTTKLTFRFVGPILFLWPYSDTDATHCSQSTPACQV